MAQVKYLDLNGLKTLFGVVDSKVAKAVEDKASKAELQAVEAKVDAIDVEGAIEDLNLSQYAKSADVESTYAKKSEIPTDFYSKQEVDSAIEEAKEAIVGEDLKDALDTLETVKEWKEEHGTEYTNLLAEVQKKADAETVSNTYQVKGDYALKSDLTGLASETFVDGKIEEVEAKIPTDYLTEDDIEDFITAEALTPYLLSATAESTYLKIADKDTFVAFTTEEIQGASNA